MKHALKQRCWKYLSYEERVQLELLRSQGQSLRQIAARMTRSLSTLCDELQRNQVKGSYTAKQAHAKSYRKRCWAK